MMRNDGDQFRIQGAAPAGTGNVSNLSTKEGSSHG